MLCSLSVRDVVLIGRLDMDFQDGLCVLTGETGAGKSIVLDALGLAIGLRAEVRLIRHGAEQASVAAEFHLPADPEICAFLEEHAIPKEEEKLVLRRVLGRDGRSRAFVNDQSVSVALLRRVGEALVEIHGQFESRRLLDSASHCDMLDAFGRLDGKLKATATAYHAWRYAEQQRIRAEADFEQIRQDEEFLRHAVNELDTLCPRPEEEGELAERRTLMMNSQKLIEAMNRAADDLADGRGVETSVQSALRTLERVADKAGGRLDEAIQALARAAQELSEGVELLEKVGASVGLDTHALEQVEERLFALRGLARKHGVEVDALADLRKDLAAKLDAAEDGEAGLEKLRRAEAVVCRAYMDAAESLNQARLGAAARLDAAVANELEPLKLGKARFITAIEDLPKERWSSKGRDRVIFQAATNPGAPAGPLAKIASGGELSRFMLALKAVLAGADSIPTLIFDEVDAGIGGATATAVGERLKALSATAQVLVVTHSPQVAAMGAHHWKIAKEETAKGVFAAVEFLDPPARREEVARMLAGAKVTQEARAAAASLMGLSAA